MTKVSAKLKVKLKQLKTESKLKLSANKNKNLGATLPGNGARKYLDTPKCRGSLKSSMCEY